MQYRGRQSARPWPSFISWGEGVHRTSRRIVAVWTVRRVSPVQREIGERSTVRRLTRSSPPPSHNVRHYHRRVIALSRATSTIGNVDSARDAIYPLSAADPYGRRSTRVVGGSLFAGSRFSATFFRRRHRHSRLPFTGDLGRPNSAVPVVVSASPPFPARDRRSTTRSRQRFPSRPSGM